MVGAGASWLRTRISRAEEGIQMRPSTLPTPRDLVPDPPFAEYHRCTVDVPADVAGQALHTVRYHDVRSLAPLMAVRQLPARLTGAPMTNSGDRLLKDVLADGFDILASISEGYLFVGVGQPFKLRSGERRPMRSLEEFADFDEPGFCRIVGDFRVTVSDGVTTVSTETVVDCTDPATRCTFARYWRLIRPFSGLIRHSMLAAVRRRAIRI